jgi:hypothetical protein
MSTSNARTTTAVVLAIELEQELGRSGAVWTVKVERPGRQGAFSRDWRAPSGALSSPQAQDLCSWVERTCMNALVAWGGIQEVLDQG